MQSALAHQASTSGRNFSGPAGLVLRNATGQIQMRKAAVAACFALWISSSPGTTAGLDVQAVNEAQFEAGKAASPAKQPLLLKAQVLLSRAHFSPGEIDGKPGANYSKALSA